MLVAQPEERSVRVGLISDIHGKLRPGVFELLEGVDRILFAGDVERLELLDELEVIAPVDAVWGNVDGHEIRRWTAESIEMELEGVQFAVTHGDRVAPRFDSLLELYPTADVIVHGHSHVPRCDRRGNRWIVNPGAATKPRSGHPASVAIALVENGEVEITHISLIDGAPFTP
jgi:putative phosphoesterase